MILRRIFFFLTAISFIQPLAFGQGTVFADFPGDDFQFSAVGLAGVGESLYVLSAGQADITPGELRVYDKTGSEFEVLRSFTGEIHTPKSLLATDTVLYGTTRFSANGGGAIFRYRIATGEYEVIRDFAPQEVQEIRIVRITNELIWGLSDTSFEDEGSLFTLDHTGANFTKVYNDTNFDTGINPVAAAFTADHIYLACYNGGGIPYPDGTGSLNASGSIIRIDQDGSNYQLVFQGRDLVGTQPAAFVQQDGEIYVRFDGSGSDGRGSLYRFGIEDEEFDSLGQLTSAGRGTLVARGGFIFGMSSSDGFVYDIANNKMSATSNFNTLATTDGSSGPAWFDQDFFYATNQGGPDGGGVLIRYNFEPEIVQEIEDQVVAQGTGEMRIDLTTVFQDRDRDEITYTASSTDENTATVAIDGNELVITETGTALTEISVTATDAGGASVTDIFMFDVNVPAELVAPIEVTLGEGTQQTLDLNDSFVDPDGDELIYSVVVSDESIATASVEAGQLTISGLVPGETQIQVEAEDVIGNLTEASIAVTVEVVLSVPAFTAAWHSYPNPLQDLLTVEFAALTQATAEVNVLDLNGKSYFRRSIQAGVQKVQLNLQSLHSGTYLLTIRGGEQTLTQRIIKR